MQNKKQKLIEVLGFPDKKATVYLAIIELREATATEIAKKSSLKRTTVYNILPELKQEGFIKSTIHNKKHFYYTENLKVIERIAEKKMNGIKELIPLLKTTQNILSVKPKITLYEGSGGMNQLYQDVIDAVTPGDKILTYIGSQNFNEFISDNVLKNYVNQRISKKVLNKIIIGQGPLAEKWKEASVSQLREVKIIKNKTEIFAADMKIYKNKIAMLSYKENFFGVVIESKEISTLCRNMFNLLWETI